MELKRLGWLQHLKKPTAARPLRAAAAELRPCLGSWFLEHLGDATPRHHPQQAGKQTGVLALNEPYPCFYEAVCLLCMTFTEHPRHAHNCAAPWACSASSHAQWARRPPLDAPCPPKLRHHCALDVLHGVLIHAAPLARFGDPGAVFDGAAPGLDSRDDSFGTMSMSCHWSSMFRGLLHHLPTAHRV